MLALALSALHGCAPTPGTDAAAPPLYTPDLSAWSGAEAACVQAGCGTSPDAAAFAACRAEKCVPHAEAWAVNPTLLRYDDGVVTMSVQVEHTPGGFGDVREPHAGDTWLGATVLTSKGEEIDMAVQTVFADRLSEPFTFSSQVGPDAEVVIVGLWGKKIEPCDSTRSGCQMFGFVLDQSLAAWPPDTYTEATPRRQRFLPAELHVAVTAAAMSPERTAALTDAMAGVWAAETQRFGTRFVTGDWAPSTATKSEVVHKHVHDGPLASRLAAALGTDVAVRHDPGAPADLAVTVAATACPPVAGAGVAQDASACR